MADILTTVGVWLCAALLLYQTTKQKAYMATLSETLTEIEFALNEASTEIPAELAKLREQLGNVLTPEASATIERIAASAKALANVIPNEQA